MIPVKIGRTANEDVILDFDTHVLIAGQSGSGKSVMLNTIITQIYASDPSAQFYMFDLKFVELIRYRKLCPVCCDLKQMLAKIRKISEIMMSRYIKCVEDGTVQYDRCPVYIVIDEYADITSRSLPEEKTIGKQIQAEIEKIARMGRAANVHLILCTQYPVATVISMTIKQQCAVKLCMKCNSSTAYRVVLGHNPENKPSAGRGQCILQRSDETETLFQGTFTPNDYVRQFVDSYAALLPQWVQDKLAKENDIKKIIGGK